MICRFQLDITTNSSGAANVTLDLSTEKPFLLYKVEWVDGDLSDGVDAVLSCTGPSGVSKTLLTLTNADNDADYYPRELEDDNIGGVTAFYAMPVVDGVVNLAVATGGNTKSGKCILYLLEV